MPVQTARRRLGRGLKREREERGMTQGAVEQAGICSKTTLWRIENGKGHVKASMVQELCTFYGSDMATITTLREFANATRDEMEADTSAAAWVTMYLDLEETCARLSYWSSWLVHALLQTDDYARAVIASDNVSEEVIRARLKLRAARQNATLTRDCLLSVVLAEGAFTQMNLGEDILAGQLQHLRELDARLGISVRILPASAPLHLGVRGPFSIMDFKDDDDPSVVYLEHLTGAQYLDRAKHIDPYRSAFTQLKELSRPIKEYAP